MRKYLGRILICTVPVLIGIVVIAWAAFKYYYGEGGFRLGVDLVGGTILVYEVDTSKMQGKNAYRADEMTTALKRRIDPNDLLNVTVRSLQGDPPRVEIVLPTGGRYQSKIEDDAWKALLDKVAERYPPPPGESYDSVATGHDGELLNRIKDFQSDVWYLRLVNNVAAFDKFIKDTYTGPKIQRGLTSEGIEQIKALIGQQGRLEFRILANRKDDGAAMAIAENYLDPKNKEAAAHKAELEKRARADEPPPPPLQVGDPKIPFEVTVNGEKALHRYSWVEIGKNELYNLHLQNAAEFDKTPIEKGKTETYRDHWLQIAAARDQGVPYNLYQNNLLWSRKIPPEVQARLPATERDKVYEYFMLTRDAELVPNPTGGYTQREITGKYLIGAGTERDDKGGLAVGFEFDTEGGNLFWDVTSRNKPDGGENSFHRQLAIILDGKIQSAPNIKQPIRSKGQISGNYSQEDVDSLVRILRAGALPATLKSKPVSENTMGATLGEDTIRSGTISVGLAFLAILIFMAVYYRFAGLVACFALLANLVLTVAFMVAVDAAFTLPGLAGLVLMLGMAVDANVLIYERVREERDRGANLALSIRNGYDRAFPTIIDTHLSSIFTAIVLYVVGNDQLKGFGISLTAGLVISLFTSLYVTRTIFDIWMGMGWLKQLKMMHLFRRPNFDFMAIRKYWFTATVILTILGGGLFLWRGNEGLNIDFVGGTLYSGQLNEYLPIGDLRKQLVGCKVDDMTVEPLFVRDAEYSKGNASKLFTIRTPEKGDTDSILKRINESLKYDKRPGHENQLLLRQIEFKWRLLGDPNWRLPNGTEEPVVKSDASDEEQRKKEMEKLTAQLEKEKTDANTLAAENKQGALLSFYNPAANNVPDYASPSRVKALLMEAWKKALEKKALKIDDVRELRVDPASPAKEERYTQMRVEVPNGIVIPEVFPEGIKKVQSDFALNPQPDRLEVFNAQLAGDTRQKALVAIVASWIAILVYLWFRFGSWTFGAAAVVCLIHDLFFTLGGIAVAHFIYQYGGPVPGWLNIQDFKIDLPAVAALLTLVGYSVSDTIVVFDRIREVRGKNPALTPQMINDSVNQTLSRTVLSSLSVWLVVLVLYWLGGEGVRLFAYVMVIGVIVGTYSSIYIASPLLLIFGEGQSVKGRAPVPQEVAPRA